jgi:bifunctional non-homologous end joining protein LigD
MTDRTIDPAADADHADLQLQRDALIARAAVESLRPQLFGKANPASIRDPLVEPVWAGIRALAAVDGDAAAIADEDGDPIDDQPGIVAALADARLAEHLVLDGYLTKMTARDGSGVFVAMDDLPTASQMVSRPLLGVRRNRAEEVTRALDAARIARSFGPEDVVSYVAMDLLAIDGESLLDVPLLERRRILESALEESELIRRGVFVRPPLDAWIGSWRALGFSGLTFKAANSRYLPGRANNDWATAPMPRR